MRNISQFRGTLESQADSLSNLWSERAPLTGAPTTDQMRAKTKGAIDRLTHDELESMADGTHGRPLVCIVPGGARNNVARQAGQLRLPAAGILPHSAHGVSSDGNIDDVWRRSRLSKFQMGVTDALPNFSWPASFEGVTDIADLLKRYQEHLARTGFVTMPREGYVAAQASSQIINSRFLDTNSRTVFAPTQIGANAFDPNAIYPYGMIASTGKAEAADFEAAERQPELHAHHGKILRLLMARNDEKNLKRMHARRWRGIEME